MNTILINPSLSINKESQHAMQFEASTTINAPAATVFALYANVNGWPLWDPDLKEAHLNGAFVSGAIGEVKPHSGPKSALTFVEVIQGKSVRMQCKLPLGMMHFDYELQAQAGIGGAAASTLATHRTTFSGLLAPLWSRLIGSSMKKTLPAALAGLKRVAEAG